MDDYRQLLNKFSGSIDDIVKKHLQLIWSIEPFNKRREIILNDYQKSKDNLFSSVFKYRLENFHSQMLRNILYPNTPETGNRQYLKLFKTIQEEQRMTIDVDMELLRVFL